MSSTKKDVIRNLVDSCSVVRLYVDPRRADVTVPQHLKSQEWLCLDVALPAALVRPIHDLEISEWGVHGTLSFGGSPYYCSVSYTAIHGVKHMSSGGIVSWISTATAALREESPPTERLPQTEPTEQTGAKVIDMAAWRRARGR